MPRRSALKTIAAAPRQVVIIAIIRDALVSVFMIPISFLSFNNIIILLYPFVYQNFNQMRGSEKICDNKQGFGYTEISKA